VGLNITPPKTKQGKLLLTLFTLFDVDVPISNNLNNLNSLNILNLFVEHIGVEPMTS
jgi:hypothetical protein